MNFIFSWQKQYYIVLPLENKIHIFAPPCNILYLCKLLSKYMRELTLVVYRRHFKKRLIVLIADEEEKYVRQIDELKQNIAKKDAELSQLQADLAKMKKVRNRLDNLNCLELYVRLKEHCHRRLAVFS